MALFATIAVVGLLQACSADRAAMLVDGLADPPAVETYRDARGDAVDLYATDTAPAPREAIFFVSGSGCASLAFFLRWYFRTLGGSYRVYAAQKAGVERRSTGLACSQEFLDRSAYPDMLERNREALRRVAARHGGRVAAVFGVSEGGTIAAQLAADGPTARRLVVIGSGGPTSREELRLIGPRRGLPPEAVEAAFREVAETPDDVHATLYGMTHRYWSTMLDVDPAPMFLRARQPALVVMGGEDEDVPVESAYRLRDRMAEAGRRDFTLRIVEGASHTLTRGGEDLKPAVMREIGAWLAR